MLKPIKVILADNHDIHRHGFAAVMKNFSEVELLAATTNGQELLHQAKLLQPDIAITEACMPGMGGLEVFRLLQKQYPHIGKIVLTLHNETRLVKQMLKAGARGYLMKNATPHEILHCIKKVYNNGTDYCKEVTAALSGLLTEEPEADCITKTEMSILRLLCLGMKTRQIAKELFYGEGSIKLYIGRLKEKCKAKTRTELVWYASQNGIVRG